MYKIIQIEIEDYFVPLLISFIMANAAIKINQITLLDSSPFGLRLKNFHKVYVS